VRVGWGDGMRAEKEALKAPLQALLVAPGDEYRKKILSGEITVTIREGARDYKPGQAVVLCCHVEPWAVMAVAKEVKHLKLGEVDAKDYGDAGFKSKGELLAGLKQFYPGINEDSVVTVIRFGDLSGKLARSAGLGGVGRCN